MAFLDGVSLLSDDELLTALERLVGDDARITATLVAHLAEVDERRLHARAGYPSLFAYCTGALHLSEPAAYLRIQAARVSEQAERDFGRVRVERAIARARSLRRPAWQERTRNDRPAPREAFEPPRRCDE